MYMYIYKYDMSTLRESINKASNGTTFGLTEMFYKASNGTTFGLTEMFYKGDATELDQK